MKRLLLLVSLVFLPEVYTMAQTAPFPTPDQKAVVEANNAFAIDLYSQLRKKDGNLFFSPESISTALAMAYAGARGETASQMASTLHFTLPQDKLHPAMGALLKGLNAEHPGYQLRVADALWAEQDYKFLDSYLDLTKADYDAGLHKVDFKTAHEAARATINAWVEEKTADKIKDLLPAGSVTPDTRLVLTNAIYFKGDWQTQFNQAATLEEEFHLSPSQSVKAPLMHLQAKFSYFDGGSFKALDIPYKSGELSMVVLLPNEVDGLAALEQSFTSANAEEWLSKVQGAQKVILTLPKFKMTRQFELGGTLSAMGMSRAFDRTEADFSGMTGERDLWISSVVHKAFVDVNEEGTEAAAATGTVMRSMAMAYERPPVVFRADHPFLFLIRDKRSGGILFMGRVADPTQ